MRKLFYFFLLTWMAGGAAAQSDVQYTHFAFNKLAYNPGYTGGKGAFDALALYRNQWSGFDGAPKTMHLNAHTPFAGKRSALGFAATADQIGKVHTNSLDLSYAYRIKIGETSTLGLGLSGRMEQVRIRWSEADPLDLGDQAIPQGDETAFTPNFGTGAFFSGKNYFAGLSVPRLLKNGLYLDRSKNTGNPITTYFMGGFIARLNRDLQLVPSVLVSYNTAAPVDVDFNMNLVLMDAFWVGGSFRLGDSFDLLAGMDLGNGLRLGVGMDFTTSELRKVTNGSWEIMLGYTFRCKTCEVNHLRFF